MNAALARTFDLLAHTPNEAAVDLLVAALDHQTPEIRRAAVESLLLRRGAPSQKAILERADKYPEEWRAAVNQRRARMTQTLRDVLLTDDDRDYANARNLIVWGHEYDLAPVLIQVVEDPRRVRRDSAGAILIDLAAALYDELSAPPSGSARRDPQLLRRHFVTILQDSIERFKTHRRREPVEAFLILACRESNQLRQILMDAAHPARSFVKELLHDSSHPGVMQLLTSFLDDAHPPATALELISARADLPFVSLLLSRIEAHTAESFRRNLGRLTGLLWLHPGSEVLSQLSGSQQAAAVRLLMGSNVRRPEVFEILQWLCQHGTPQGRRAALAAMSKFMGVAANELVMNAAQDEDPNVQASAMPLLKMVGGVSSLKTLLGALDSPHEVVQEAARATLVEFSFERYAAAFDTLDDRSRKRGGRLVRKIDLKTVQNLRDELHNSVRARRIRAIEMTPFLEAVTELESELIATLDDRDHFIRAAACRSLGHSDGPEAYLAICRLQDDASQIVRNAARSALIYMDRRVYRLAETLPQ